MGCASLKTTVSPLFKYQKRYYFMLYYNFGICLFNELGTYNNSATAKHGYFAEASTDAA